MDAVKEGIRRNLIELLSNSDGKNAAGLAQACGVSRGAVSNWKSGESSIDIERIPKICDYFEISVDAFFGRAEELEPLTKDELELVRFYKKISPEGKAAIMTLIREIEA